MLRRSLCSIRWFACAAFALLTFASALATPTAPSIICPAAAQTGTDKCGVITGIQTNPTISFTPMVETGTTATGQDFQVRIATDQNFVNTIWQSKPGQGGGFSVIVDSVNGNFTPTNQTALPYATQLWVSARQCSRSDACATYSPWSVGESFTTMADPLLATVQRHVLSNATAATSGHDTFCDGMSGVPVPIVGGLPDPACAPGSGGPCNCAFKTITTGVSTIEAATPTNGTTKTLFIHAGTYTTGTNFNLSENNWNLIGDGVGISKVATLKIEGDTGNEVNITGSNIFISGFTFNGPDNNTSAPDTKIFMSIASAQNVTFKNVNFNGQYQPTTANAATTVKLLTTHDVRILNPITTSTNGPDDFNIQLTRYLTLYRTEIRGGTNITSGSYQTLNPIYWHMQESYFHDASNHGIDMRGIKYLTAKRNRIEGNAKNFFESFRIVGNCSTTSQATCTAALKPLAVCPQYIVLENNSMDDKIALNIEGCLIDPTNLVPSVTNQNYYDVKYLVMDGNIVDGSGVANQVDPATCTTLPGTCATSGAACKCYSLAYDLSCEDADSVNNSNGCDNAGTTTNRFNTSTTQVFLDYNIYYRPSSGNLVIFDDTTYSSGGLTAYRNGLTGFASYSGKEAHTLFSNPTLTDTQGYGVSAGGDFTPLAGSPAIDAGDPALLIPALPPPNQADAPVDIGAVETVGSVSPVSSGQFLFSGISAKGFNLMGVSSGQLSRVLGTVTDAGTYALCNQTGQTGMNCRTLTISCPGIASRQVEIKTGNRSQTSTVKGTITIFSGSQGTGFWESAGSDGTDADTIVDTYQMIDQLRTDGYKVVQMRHLQTGGWLASDAGVVAGANVLACVPATVWQWIYDNEFLQSGVRPADAGFGFLTGSAGGSQVAYTLGQYANASTGNTSFATQVDGGVYASGPVFERIDYACCGTTPPNITWRYETPVGSGGTKSLDATFGDLTLDTAGPCSSQTVASSVMRAASHDRNVSTDVMSIPQAAISFLFGELDYPPDSSNQVACPTQFAASTASTAPGAVTSGCAFADRMLAAGGQPRPAQTNIVNVDCSTTFFYPNTSGGTGTFHSAVQSGTHTLQSGLDNGGWQLGNGVTSGLEAQYYELTKNVCASNKRTAGICDWSTTGTVTEVTLGNTTEAHAITRGHNTKLLYDPTGGRWWAAWLTVDPSSLNCDLASTPTITERCGLMNYASSNDDGSTWTSPTILAADMGAGFTAYDAHMVGADMIVLMRSAYEPSGYNPLTPAIPDKYVMRRLTVSGATLTIAETAILHDCVTACSGATGDNAITFYGSFLRDSNGFYWVTAMREDGGANSKVVILRSTNANDITTWGTSPGCNAEGATTNACNSFWASPANDAIFGEGEKGCILFDLGIEGVGNMCYDKGSDSVPSTGQIVFAKNLSRGANTWASWFQLTNQVNQYQTSGSPGADTTRLDDRRFSAVIDNSTGKRIHVAFIRNDTGTAVQANMGYFTFDAPYTSTASRSALQTIVPTGGGAEETDGVKLVLDSRTATQKLLLFYIDNLGSNNYALKMIPFDGTTWGASSSATVLSDLTGRKQYPQAPQSVPAHGIVLVMTQDNATTGYDIIARRVIAP